MQQKKALTNYYARLIAKDRMDISDVPNEIKDDVRKQVIIEQQKLEEYRVNEEL